MPLDSDGDGRPDGDDPCPNDPAKVAPGYCGCGTKETVYGALEQDASTWGVYIEGSASSAAPQRAFDAEMGRDVLVCALKDAAPYSNAHCYVELAANLDA